MPPDIKIDIKNIQKYPEFKVFKQELLKFHDTISDINDIQIDSVSRATVIEEIIGRRWAADKVKDFLIQLGVLAVEDIKKDKTYE